MYVQISICGYVRESVCVYMNKGKACDSMRVGSGYICMWNIREWMESVVSWRKHLHWSVGSKTMVEYVLKSEPDVPILTHALSISVCE